MENVPESLPASRRIIARSAALGATATLIPFPLADSLSVTAVQLKMLEELASLHGQQWGKGELPAVLASVGGGLLNFFVGRSPPAIGFKNLVLAIPAIGPLLRFGTGPALVGAYTWMLGEAFRRHFAQGGTPSQFTAVQFRDVMREYLPLP